MRKSLRIISGAAAVSIVLPLMASAQTTNTSAQVAALTAQLQQLLAQVAALQAQLANSGGSSGATGGSANASCPGLSRALSVGMSGADVSGLQEFLTQTGDYTYGQITGYYGSATEAAVQRFQAEHSIVSSGSPSTTGYGAVGPMTRSTIAGVCNGSTSAGTGSNSSAPVGGYIQVTPASGASPLTVTVRATVNTAGSCSGAVYVLNWGDGTAQQDIVAPSGDCAQLVQTLQHVYGAAGTYRVTLSAGTHQTSATVTVFNGNGTQTGSGTATGSCGAASNMPSESFKASSQSGGSPLTVTFTGIVNSNDPGFCTSDRIDALDFGDGTYAKVQLPSSAGGWLQYSVTHTYQNPGGYIVRLHQGPLTSNDEIGHMTVTVSPGSSSSSTHGQGETFTVSSTTGAAPFTTTFSGVVNSNDASFGSGDGYDYLDFGDGTMSKIQLPTSEGGWINYSVPHTYTASGGFVAKLHQGNLSSTEIVGSSQLITVNPSTAGSGSNGYDIISLTPGYNNNVMEVNLVIELPSCAQYQIDWGDSSSIGTQTAPCSSGAKEASIQHVYSASGSYTVKLNDGSGSAEASASVTIS